MLIGTEEVVLEFSPSCHFFAATWWSSLKWTKHCSLSAVLCTVLCMMDRC